MAIRVIPLTGTEAQRQTAAASVLANELHTTTDQKRVFLENRIVAPVWHGSVANQAAMLALNGGTYGCWPGDVCLRSDVNAVYRCITNNGTSSGDWVPVGPLRQSSVADVSDSMLPANGSIAAIDFSSLPANGSIAALTFSMIPTQAECEALRDKCEQIRDAVASTVSLRDECENLRDALANAISTIETLRDRLKTTGGCGLLAD